MNSNEILNKANEHGALHWDGWLFKTNDELLAFANVIADAQREDAKICEELRVADWCKHAEAIRANKETTEEARHVITIKHGIVRGDVCANKESATIEDRIDEGRI